MDKRRHAYLAALELSGVKRRGVHLQFEWTGKTLAAIKQLGFCLDSCIEGSLCKITLKIKTMFEISVVFKALSL